MENQTITTTTAPRITLKKSGMKRLGLGWEIASSSSKDKAELKSIVKMLTVINEDMETAFNKKEEKKKW